MAKASDKSLETQALADDSGSIPIGEIVLRVIEGPDTGTIFRATSDIVRIGSDESNHMVLSDNTVSRFHCEFRITENKLILRDCGSRNGTLCNGVILRDADIFPGVQLSIGQSKLICERGIGQIKLSLSSRDQFGGMVGSSFAMRKAFSRLERAAQLDSTVLLTGETGTGKEVAAESLDIEGDNAEQPFVVVDCSAIPADLIESELFGHEKGSFTGASSTRNGAFREADGGTIFLDEIGELPLEFQPKLLRVLEQRKVRRVGSSAYQPVHVRVVAATNRDLRQEVNEGRFRSDLFYRLAVLEVELPPLRERRDDIPALVKNLISKMSEKMQRLAHEEISDEVISRMAQQDWPGNVRELRNHIERYIAFRDEVETQEIESTSDATGDLVDLDLPFREAREKWAIAMERHYLEGLLRRFDGKTTEAAAAAGINRVYFYKLMRRAGVTVKEVTVDSAE